MPYTNNDLKFGGVFIAHNYREILNDLNVVFANNDKDLLKYRMRK